MSGMFDSMNRQEDIKYAKQFVYESMGGQRFPGLQLAVVSPCVQWLHLLGLIAGI